MLAALGREREQTCSIGSMALRQFQDSIVRGLGSVPSIEKPFPPSWPRADYRNNSARVDSPKADLDEATTEKVKVTSSITSLILPRLPGPDVEKWLLVGVEAHRSARRCTPGHQASEPRSTTLHSAMMFAGIWLPFIDLPAFWTTPSTLSGRRSRRSQGSNRSSRLFSPWRRAPAGTALTRSPHWGARSGRRALRLNRASQSHGIHTGDRFFSFRFDAPGPFEVRTGRASGGCWSSYGLVIDPAPGMTPQS